MKLRTLVAISALIAFGSMQSVLADEVVWGNSATFGNVNLEAFSINAGGVATLLQQFLVPNLTARANNGRGVAVLGNTIYYTTASSGDIYITDAISHADGGILVSTGFPGIANVATDGTYIYASSYQTASGVVNKYDTAGVLQGTVSVGSGSGRDGFEVQNNPNLDGGATTFISNRGDANSPYDVYKADGTLLAPDFIDPSASGFGTGQTGIAYDGTNYFVSDLGNNRLFKYSGTGAYLQTVDLSGIPNQFTRRLLEDLSSVGNTVGNPGSGSVPEPTSVLLFGTVLVGIGALRRNKRRVNS